MAVFVRRTRFLRKSASYLMQSNVWMRTSSEEMSSSDVSTALRPFYFRVHPDKFHRFPNERDVNENSLKLVNEYLFNLINKTQKCAFTTVSFYVQERSEIDGSSQNSDLCKLRKIDLSLSPREDVPTTVRRILSSIQISKESANISEKFEPSSSSFEKEFYELRRREKNVIAFIKREIETKPSELLTEWLMLNIDAAREKQRICKPTIEDICRLKSELKRDLKLKDLILNIDWSVSHVRGSLLSLKTLAVQHQKQIGSLNNRVVVFGKMTGVSYDGRIMFNIEDVRHNWLNLINSVHKFDDMLACSPLLNNELSRTLNDIEIRHRKFGPLVLIQTHILQMRKFISNLKEYKIKFGFPKDLPPSLKKFSLVVESDAGPLMLSPTGQFIVPSSCPAGVFLDFIIENMKEAEYLIRNYEATKSEETNIVSETINVIGLQSLEKDDNVTPDLMITCCQKLIKHKEQLSPFLTKSQLRISHFYSVLADGRICVPWNWNL